MEDQAGGGMSIVSGSTSNSFTMIRKLEDKSILVLEDMRLLLQKVNLHRVRLEVEVKQGQQKIVQRFCYFMII